MATRIINENREVKALFNKFYKGKKNIMTPDALEYGTVGELTYEISSGEFLGMDLYGLTLLETNPLARSEHSDLFFSIKEIHTFMDKL
jgi:hypothetical protein